MVYQITVRIKRGLGVSVVCPQIFESFGGRVRDMDTH